MGNKFGRVFFVVLCLLLLTPVLFLGCLGQPCHNPVDTISSVPVLLPDNHNNLDPVPNPHNINPRQTASIPQPVSPYWHQTAAVSQPISPYSSLPNNNYYLPPPNHLSSPVSVNPDPRATPIVPATFAPNPPQQNIIYLASNNTTLPSRNTTLPSNNATPSSNNTPLPSSNAALPSTNSVIVQASLQNSQESVNSGNGSLSGIRIDPSLGERGWRVVAEGGLGEGFSGAWRPSASFGFFPYEEYLADGGDGNNGDNGGRHRNAKVTVSEDWLVRNLEVGDTAVHYDTVDGRTVVGASNRVHIYSPRFGAVRKVEGVVNTGHISYTASLNHQQGTGTGKSAERTDQTAQEFVAGYTRGRDDLRGVRSRIIGAGVGAKEGVIGYSNAIGVMSYSDALCSMNLGSAEIIHLAEGCENARVWQAAEGVKVKATYSTPMSATTTDGVGQLFKIDDAGITGKSQLRLIKVASKRAAKSGDVIEFTLRFDNLGTEPLGNITIMDNLTTRLEFIPDSAVSSVPSGFLVESNVAASLTLRFEITEPLESGKFGVIQFKCKVL
ncbi:MAG: hypothetical protein LBT09_09000 [Planctomycetaceae bacterium]|jgi:uncharacterized repeat protein (TIGR01451 family)|nr:hypothetical protein [Planctomycetaceae bacterium]